MKYYIMDIKGADEFTIGTAETKEDAIKIARDEWLTMNDYDRGKNTIEVRLYEEDIEAENCECFDYNTVEWNDDIKGGR